jgi:hypothetical protein
MSVDKPTRELLGFSEAEWDDMSLDDRIDAIHEYYNRARAFVFTCTLGLIALIWIVPICAALSVKTP